MSVSHIASLDGLIAAPVQPVDIFKYTIACHFAKFHLLTVRHAGQTSHTEAKNANPVGSKSFRVSAICGLQGPVPPPHSARAPPNTKDAASALPSLFPRTMTTYDDYGMPVDAYGEPESLAHQAWRVARAFVLYRLKPRWQESRRRWHWKSILSLGKVLIVIWLVTLYYGERAMFKSSVGSCEWENWESWVCPLVSEPPFPQT